VLEHCVSGCEAWEGPDFVEAGSLEARQAFEDLLGCPDKARALDQVGASEALLFGEHPAVVSFVDALMKTLAGKCVQHYAVLLPERLEQRRWAADQA
jgi:hypothetical protein